MQTGSRLYARRLRGDIGPIQKDPRTNLPGRILAPAVSLTGVYQDYDEEDATKNFTIGSRMVVDERAFHYSRAVAALVAGAFPCTTHLSISTDQILAVNDLVSVGATLALATTIVATVGAFQAGVVTTDEFVGGHVDVVPVGATGFMWRKIIANTATAVGGAITITVDRPFDLPTLNASQVTINPPVYRRVECANTNAALAGFATAIGLAPIPVPINHYFWLQTWGPCWIAPNNVIYPFANIGHLDVYFHASGVLGALGETASFLAEYNAGANRSPQRVGYALGAGIYGSGAVMLQLAP